MSLGIDIETIKNFPNYSDGSETNFFLDTFTEYELQYCKKRVDINLSLVGIFCLKEAIIKADNSLIGMKFNLIEIKHNENGKPVKEGFDLSLSHTNGICVGIAQKVLK
jgi:phosphopantetheine--protein transferase-like protein